MIFSIITATFNRRDRIQRVYESLKTQTFRDFEWIVVDDGSTDGTGELVVQWQEKADFPIVYKVKENGGKHTAVNVGVKMARGAYVILLDSDDACIPEALEVFHKGWDEVSRDDIGIIAVLCQDQHGRLVGTKFPGSPWDSDHREMIFRWRMKGDKWECYRREVLLQFPFPEPFGVKVLPESIVLNEIARKYKTRYLNKILRIYFDDGQDSSLVRTSDPSKNAAGSRLRELSKLNGCVDYLFWAPDLLLASAVKYIRACFYLDISLKNQIKDIKGGAKLLWLFALVPAWVIVHWERTRKTNVSGKLRHFT